MEMLLVFVGGGSGAVLRYLTSLLAKATMSETLFMTIIVNVIGSLAFGLLQSRIANPQLKLLIFPGLLGGFTTFSAFSAEAIGLAQQGRYLMFAAYVGLSVTLSLAAFAFMAQ